MAAILEGAGIVAVQHHDGFRLSDGGECGGGEGFHSPDSCHGGASLRGPRAFRLSPGLNVPGRPTIKHIHDSGHQPGFSIKSVRPSGGPEVDYGESSFLEGVGYHCYQTCRIGGGIPCFSITQEEGRRPRQSEASCRGGGDPVVEGGRSELELLNQKLDFERWANCLPRWVLGSRNDFAWHLRRSFSVKWSGLPDHTAVFPLPVPFPGIFDGSGPGLSKRRLRILAQKRVVHLITYVLDYLYLGRFPTVDELRRPHGRIQEACVRRLYNFVAACGNRPGEFPCAPGRSGPELISCMDLLRRFTEETDLQGAGYGGFRGSLSSEAMSMRKEESENYPELQPFRSLCVDRLKISGRGEWPLSEYLESELWLPFNEPAFLRKEPGPDVVGPDFSREVRSEYWKLAMKWQELGLLRLHEPPEDSERFCRVFNTYKDSANDRQIGDRRRVNGSELPVTGPSRRLPNGPLLLNMMVRRGSHGLRCSITDRRDFYHQIQVSSERSRTNMTPFGFPASEFSGGRALEIYQEELFARKKAAKDRSVAGDRLGLSSEVFRDGGLLHPSFGALFQGDHLGVEFALEGHQNLLKREGLLCENRRVQGGEAPFLRASSLTTTSD